MHRQMFLHLDCSSPVVFKPWVKSCPGKVVEPCQLGYNPTFIFCFGRTCYKSACIESKGTVSLASLYICWEERQDKARSLSGGKGSPTAMILVLFPHNSTPPHAWLLLPVPSSLGLPPTVLALTPAKSSLWIPLFWLCNATVMSHVCTSVGPMLSRCSKWLVRPETV